MIADWIIETTGCLRLLEDQITDKAKLLEAECL
jgi:hypothetical protein